MLKKKLLVGLLFVWCLAVAGWAMLSRVGGAAAAPLVRHEQRRAAAHLQHFREAIGEQDVGPGLQEPAYGSVPEVKP